MSKKSKGGPGDYVIGRGKPPKHTRFKPGQSGNPHGRSQRARNLTTILTDVLGSEMDLTENGRQRRVPRLEALILRLVQDGLKGHVRATNSLLDRYERHVGAGPEPRHELADEDRALLARGLNKMEANVTEAGGEESDG